MATARTTAIATAITAITIIKNTDERSKYLLLFVLIAFLQHDVKHRIYRHKMHLFEILRAQTTRRQFYAFSKF